MATDAGATKRVPVEMAVIKTYDQVAAGPQVYDEKAGGAAPAAIPAPSGVSHKDENEPLADADVDYAGGHGGDVPIDEPSGRTIPASVRTEASTPAGGDDDVYVS